MKRIVIGILTYCHMIPVSSTSVTTILMISYDFGKNTMAVVCDGRLIGRICAQEGRQHGDDAMTRDVEDFLYG